MWLAAVSAGPDSMALLQMCLDQNVPVAAAHVNYHHRAEADEEESYVRSFCVEKNIPLHVLNDPFVYEGNFEAAARTWRYDFFEKTVRTYGYRGVLIAHQEDDLIETYLMQKERNLVPAYYGLKEEMMYHGVLIRRPLLGYTKKQLEEYCRQKGVRYYIDSTNASDDYARNRIRHETVETMSRFGRDMMLQQIRMENAVLQERRCRVGALSEHDRVPLAQYRMLNEEDRLTLLRMTAESGTGRHHTLAHLKQIDAVLLKQDDFMIPFDGRVIVQKDGLFFTAEQPRPYRYEVRNEQEALATQAEWFRIEQGVPGVNAVTVKEEDYPLIIRNAQQADRIAMRFGTKKVHRFFIDRHIPLYERSTWPVVENAAGSLILVPGLGCDKIHHSISPTFSVIQYSH